MIELGKRQTLTLVKRVDFGVYLAESREDQVRVLLPAKQVPEGSQVGDTLEVFVYRDSRDRLISTTHMPKLALGETAVLKVADVGKIGAFLDWGLEKDLLLPFREQTRRVRPGEEVLAALYLDKSGRLCGTMKVYHYLRTDAPYKKDDMVKGRVYEISDNFGAFVAVDDTFSGLINRQEYFGNLTVGQLVEARVRGVKEDGKLDLSVRERIPQQMEKDAQLVLQVLEEYDGVLPFNDKVSPEIIERELHLSKNAFKRAVGHLLKEGKIEITEKRILRR
ncbi:MAG: RNA-binding protein [Lachnospiraceae bacterium]|nr:RNA-binding protein [Lachnospiraceae bacterium]